MPYTVIGANTIQIQLDIVGGELDPSFVLASYASPPGRGIPGWIWVEVVLGVALVLACAYVYVMWRKSTPTRSAELVLSPAYLGTVDFKVGVPDNKNIIKDQLVDLSTDALSFGTPDPGLGRAGLPSPVTSERRRKTILKVIPEPDALTRSVIHGTSDQVPPFFTGTGNLDYLCGRCGSLLAQRVWSLSMSDIVLHCPFCKSFNDLPVVQTVL